MQCPRCGSPVGQQPPCPNCGFAPPGYVAAPAEPSATYPQAGGYDQGPPQGYPQQGPPQGYPPQPQEGYLQAGPGQGYPQGGGYDQSMGGVYPQQGAPQGYPPQGGYDQGPPPGYPPQGMGGMAPSGGFTQGGDQFGMSPFGQAGQGLGLGGGMGMGGGQPASLGKRFLARLVDGAVVFAFLLVVAMAFGEGLVPTLLLAVFLAAYEIAALLVREGQTVGKMALKLRTVSSDGSPIDPQRAGIRAVPFFIAYLVGAFVPLLGGLLLLVMVVDFLSPVWGGERKLAFHDKFAKTMVVEAG